MSKPQYQWRRLTPQQRAELLEHRKAHGHPWHSPQHRPNSGNLCFHITAACYEHRPLIGHSGERMDAFTADLLAAFATDTTRAFAWCVLPNHYHALIETPDVLRVLRELGHLHGRTSYDWNGEEQTRGRKVFFRAVERAMRSERHFWASLNYVLHNPVHHGYVSRWTDWPWSNATQYLTQMGSGAAERIWREYPIRDYGKGWDEAEM